MDEVKHDGITASSLSSNEIISLAARSICYVFDGNTEPCKDERAKPLGTGFLVLIRLLDPLGNNKQLLLLITCRHIIRNLDSIVARVNNKENTAIDCQKVELTPDDVIFPDDATVDLAAIILKKFEKSDPLFLDKVMVLSKEDSDMKDVIVGTDIFSIGVFRGYPGRDRNYPITKFGKIAMQTDDYWYQAEPNSNFEQGHVVELQNVPGMSGAPVLLLSPQFLVTKDRVFRYRNLDPLVVGVVKGTLTSPLGGTQGIAVIEPADNLSKLLDKISKGLESQGCKIVSAKIKSE